MVGRSVQVYLPDGTVSGIRHGQIANWTGQAIACPRSRFRELREWAEVRKPGVYFLYGVDEETGRDQAYIGEAENVLDRLANHLANKDFWGEVVVFTSKDENLTKGHVRFLEARLVQIALDAGRDLMVNSARPQLPSMPRADCDAMEEFIEQIRLLLGVMGHKTLDRLAVLAGSSGAGGQEASTAAPEAGLRLTLKSANLLATAVQTDEGVVVLSGSQAADKVAPSLSDGYRNLRSALIDQGILVDEPNGQKAFSRDHLFSSPTQAAQVVLGYPINGRQAWRAADGRTLADAEKDLV